MRKREQLLRLSTIPGLTGRRWLKAAQQLSEGKDVDDMLAQNGLEVSQRDHYHHLSQGWLKTVNKWLSQSPLHHLITALDPLYPAQLTQISCFPPLLYVKGDPSVLGTSQLAVVGSRQCSHSGRYWCEGFTQALSLSGFTITSGLALGIDGVAHRAALNVRGKTVAVLGSGLAHLYPKRHVALAQEIVEQGGAVISEFPLDAPPLAHRFPRRNRIISGLSQGVLVIEASLKSGSLVTARYALEQNRAVYALPGALGNSGSEGTNWLIQQGAMLVAHPNNIIEDLRAMLNWLPVTQSDEIYSDASDDAPLPFAELLANVGDEVTPVDVVAERAGQPVPVITAQLLTGVSRMDRSCTRRLCPIKEGMPCSTYSCTCLRPISTTKQKWVLIRTD